MAEGSFESDPHLVLLTDALRAGPGSPQWHEAVTRLRAQGGREMDEYRLICTARERLASGRHYREVRPGPAFTQKLMSRLAVQSLRRSTMTATLVAMLSALVVLAVIVTVVLPALRGRRQAAESQLAAVQFMTPILSTDFAGGIPPEWRTIGEAPLVLSGDRGLRAAAEKGKEYRGSGIVTTSALPAGPLAVDATLRVLRPTDQIVAQLFVTDDPSFEGRPQAISPHELVAWFAAGQATVATPDGQLHGPGRKLLPDREPADPVTVHLAIRLDQRLAIVQCAGQTIYSGPHGLASGRPRWAGVRFLVRGTDRTDAVTVQSLRILRP